MTRTLAWRVTASCLVVALVAVGVAAAVALRLVSSTAREVTQQVLGQQADVVATQLDGVRVGRVVPVLRAQGISVVLLGGRRDTGPLGKVLDAAGADRAEAGTSVSTTVDVGGHTWVVEARPTTAGGFALVRATDDGPLGTGVIRRNLLFAFLAGIGVALIVGVVVGTLTARPLRRTAAAAHELRTGRRDVRVPENGPSEVAEVAGAVNDLADALAASEARRREFLLSVSHELRTPLTAVRGFAESLADGVVTGRGVPAAGATIVAEADRLDRLVGDLAELARLESDDFRVDVDWMDLCALARAAAAVWDARCRGVGVAFRLEAPLEPDMVVADPRRLRQVIDGLAENALRVTPAGAPLVLAVFPGGTVQVRDGGPGLATEDYPVVFDRGALHDRYRGHRPVGAGGVGLALAHGLVTRMGATIEAGPAPEGGACFTIRFSDARAGSGTVRTATGASPGGPPPDAERGVRARR